jgi:hypothetical protein
MDERTRSAADVNRRLSLMLREVARRRLLARLDAQPIGGEPRTWTRDDAYEQVPPESPSG